MKNRIPKPISQMVQDCETHLYFLWDALRLFRNESERYKQIASELRILVCQHGRNKALLLNLMDEFGFVYEINPPADTPLPHEPIPLVGWQDDPVEKQFAQELSGAIGDEQKLAEVLAKRALQRRPLLLREFVDRALAVHIAPYDYSFKELTLAVAQQMGSSHEDDTIEEPLAKMLNIYFFGNPSYAAILVDFGRLVLNAGEQFLEFMIHTHNYEPKYFKRQSGAEIGNHT